MSASHRPAEAEKTCDLAALMMMLRYAEAEARALGGEDAARHIALAVRLMTPPAGSDWGLERLETKGEA